MKLSCNPIPQLWNGVWNYRIIYVADGSAVVHLEESICLVSLCDLSLLPLVVKVFFLFFNLAPFFLSSFYAALVMIQTQWCHGTVLVTNRESLSQLCNTVRTLIVSLKILIFSKQRPSVKQINKQPLFFMSNTFNTHNKLTSKIPLKPFTRLKMKQSPPIQAHTLSHTHTLCKITMLNIHK